MHTYMVSLENLRTRVDTLRHAWTSQEPYRYLIIDDFLEMAFAEAILHAYPKPDPEIWKNTAYIHQRKKFTLTTNFPEPVAQYFAMMASEELRQLMTEITDIPALVDDPVLIGGGLHQIMQGGFLDVHVDYNFHPTSKLHRRLNLLLYMNKDWKPEYEGYLELWELTSSSKRQLEHIAPLFNRAVMFETNENSYHGHPRPLNTPPGVSRKSLAVYYYTADRDPGTIAPEHNTLYKQTTGLDGYLKTASAATKAMLERVEKQSILTLGKDLARRSYRMLRGLPPENK